MASTGTASGGCSSCSNAGVEKGVKSVKLNGAPATMPIAPQNAGSINEVVVTMG